MPKIAVDLPDGPLNIYTNGDVHDPAHHYTVSGGTITVAADKADAVAAALPGSTVTEDS